MMLNNFIYFHFCALLNRVELLQELAVVFTNSEYQDASLFHDVVEEIKVDLGMMLWYGNCNNELFKIVVYFDLLQKEDYESLNKIKQYYDFSNPDLEKALSQVEARWKIVQVLDSFNNLIPDE